jgi:hypothetical protein
MSDRRAGFVTRLMHQGSHPDPTTGSLSRPIYGTKRGEPGDGLRAVAPGAGAAEAARAPDRKAVTSIGKPFQNHRQMAE